MKVKVNAFAEGKVKEPFKDHTCTSCHSVIELEPSDLKYQSDQRDGDACVYRCPVCKHENWIAVDKIPHWVLFAVRGY